MKSKIAFREVCLLIFFSVQVVGIVMGRFTDTKYFCWAPYDEISFYEISVTINEKELSRDETGNRYRMNPKARENRSIQNVISIVRQFETTYGSKDHSRVEISYVTNGHKKRTWIWPDDRIVSKN